MGRGSSGGGEGSIVGEGGGGEGRIAEGIGVAISGDAATFRGTICSTRCAGTK